MLKTLLGIATAVCISAGPVWADAAESAKLDKVLSNQEQILKTLDEIKAELAVVKVRATNR